MYVLPQNSASKYEFLSYRLSDCSNPHIVLTDCDDNHAEGETFLAKIEFILGNIEVQAKTFKKEKFLTDLRHARETYTGDDLKKQLKQLKCRLYDPNIMSGDVVLNFLATLRDVQDYDAMVRFVDELKSIPDRKLYTSTTEIKHLYGFALNRRNEPGDRDRALQVRII